MCIYIPEYQYYMFEPARPRQAGTSSGPVKADENIKWFL